MNQSVNLNKQYWDDAYDNSKSIGGSEDFIEQCTELAEQFRDRTRTEERFLPDISYGNGERQCFDLFLPESKTDSLGLVMFIHGGYWHRLGREFFSHMAKGSTARGWTVAIPSYDLCPNVGIDEIARQMASALTSAVEQTGSGNKPIRLIGHSAGGHLVTRLVSKHYSASDSDGDHDSKRRLLDDRLIRNIQKIVSVSGLHDLRPLLNTTMNDTLALTEITASCESPALLAPVGHMPITCWVGAEELPELKRQTSLLANIWRGFGIPIDAIAEPNKNHFNVIEGLCDPSSPIVAKLLS